MDRRHALLGGLAASGLSAAGWRLAAPASAAPVPGRLMGADAALGHRLRAGDFPEPDGETRTGVVIVGGGVAGLSAAWQLQARGLRTSPCWSWSARSAATPRPAPTPSRPIPGARTTSRC